MDTLTSPFTIIVRTGKKEKVHPFDDQKGAYIVDISAEPVRGKANLAVIRLLTKTFKRQVRITSGHQKRKKVMVFLE